MNALNEVEINILKWIGDTFKCGFLDFLMPKITMFAEAGIGWILLAIILVCFKKTRKSAIMMGVAMVLGVTVGNVVIKNLVGRMRPYEFDASIVPMIEKLSDRSFPSGHTLASFESCTVLMMTHRKSLGWASLVLAVIIALSRMYVLVHYPTDVLGGAVLGVLFAVAAYFIVNAVYKRFIDKNTEDIASFKS